MYVLCRQYTSDYKLETYLKVARLYLEDEDPVQAEAYINRASLLQAESTREDLQIHYKARSTCNSAGSTCNSAGSTCNSAGSTCNSAGSTCNCR